MTLPLIHNLPAAVLFKDADYGQWGLEILSAQEALAFTAGQKEIRSVDYEEDDLIIGKFLGDSELLVLNNHLLIAQPIDPRSAWPVVASSFTRFLEQYIKGQ